MALHSCWQSRSTCFLLLQVSEIAFLGVALFLVVTFFAYHMWLITRGTTTYENFKWREVARKLRAQQMAEQAANHGQSEEIKLQIGSRTAKWQFWTRRQPRSRSVPVIVPRNIYNGPFAANVKDALFPPFMAMSRGDKKKS